jgi:hypothetical protein
MPILTHYALARHSPRPLKRLYDRRVALLDAMTVEYFKYNKVKMLDGSEPGVPSRAGRPVKARRRAAR